MLVVDVGGWLMVGGGGWLVGWVDGEKTHVEFLAVVGDLEHSDVGDEGAARQVERPHLTAAARKGLHRLVAHHGAVGQVQRPQPPAADLTRMPTMRMDVFINKIVIIISINKEINR
jgi:hypothetical protein